MPTNNEPRKIDGRRYVAGLRTFILWSERQYEISSLEMPKRLSLEVERETDEILKWMQAYHVLALLTKTTCTAGTPMICCREN